jgi:hypothetical protein
VRFAEAEETTGGNAIAPFEKTGLLPIVHFALLCYHAGSGWVNAHLRPRDRALIGVGDAIPRSAYQLHHVVRRIASNLLLLSADFLRSIAFDTQKRRERREREIQFVGEPASKGRSSTSVFRTVNLRGRMDSTAALLICIGTATYGSGRAGDLVTGSITAQVAAEHSVASLGLLSPLRHYPTIGFSL